MRGWGGKSSKVLCTISISTQYPLEKLVLDGVELTHQSLDDNIDEGNKTNMYAHDLLLYHRKMQGLRVDVTYENVSIENVRHLL